MTDPNSSLPPRGAKAVRGGAPTKPKARGLSIFKGVIILMVIALVGMIGYGVYLYYQAKELVIDLGTEEVVAPEKTADVSPISLLLLGIDYREELRSANTDVIMVATLNPKSKTATLVSIPRDSYIDPEGLKPNKANSFYSTYLYGNLSEAPKDRTEREKYAMDKIKNLYSDYLDVPIDYVTVVDFQTFVDVVDAYGGLTIDVDQNMCHRDNADGTYINLKAGLQDLDGKQALDFVRYRMSMNCSPKTKASNDFERNARQQQVISKLLEKMKTPQGLLKVGSVFDAVSSHVKTNIPSQQIEKMIQTYIGIDGDKIDYIHLEGDWDGHYVRLAPDEVEEASLHLQNQLLPDGPPAAAESEGAAEAGDAEAAAQ
ncbi:LCP family protein [Paenibacillus sp.]|uniref:LCP family protein n=1 Tax=Paenibacillus sp. TaxID=58172 RepID=UPI002D69A1EE|nr:LCP family protein [Paenibacillus sp.]HZG88290.1 LCP family protein [Paenibacillus sp.]